MTNVALSGEASLPVGRHFVRGSEGYEDARRATVWNGRLPDRFPEVIVQARDVDDVAAAVLYAEKHGHRVGVCSGGRSWSANHLRDGGLLLDVGGLDECSVDLETKTATVGPGKAGNDFALELEKHGLFFPAGHCTGVALGGYLLQGGYGWNGRALGPACESVVGVDVVTAGGERLHCTANEHADLYWAARGAGPGFPAVVTGFHLTLHPRLEVTGGALYVYPMEIADEVYSWAQAIGPEVDPRVELQVVATGAAPFAGIDQPVLVIPAPVFADSESEAVQALSLLETFPRLDKALFRVPFMPMDLATWYQTVMSSCPTGHRYATDNMWTSASAAELLPGIRQIVETMPPYPSQFLWVNWGPAGSRPDMAFSLEDQILLSLCAAWADPADDARYGDWARSNMAAMEHLATGIQLADENLGERPAKFASDASMARLDAVRAAYDPSERFHAWMGRVRS